MSMGSQQIINYTYVTEMGGYDNGELIYYIKSSYFIGLLLKWLEYWTDNREILGTFTGSG